MALLVVTLDMFCFTPWHVLSDRLLSSVNDDDCNSIIIVKELSVDYI